MHCDMRTAVTAAVHLIDVALAVVAVLVVRDNGRCLLLHISSGGAEMPPLLRTCKEQDCCVQAFEPKIRITMQVHTA